MNALLLLHQTTNPIKSTPPIQTNIMKTHSHKPLLAVATLGLILQMTPSSQAEETKSNNTATTIPHQTSPHPNHTAKKTTPQKAKETTPQQQKIIETTSFIFDFMTIATNPTPIIISAPLHYIWKSISQ